jgi:hypothetical protein
MPLLNRSTRTKIVGALLATAALSVGAGALPATAAQPARHSAPVSFHMKDGLKSVLITDGEGGGGVCLSTNADNQTLRQVLPLNTTYKALSFRYPGCNIRTEPIIGIGEVNASWSTNYDVHHWGFKKL